MGKLYLNKLVNGENIREDYEYERKSLLRRHLLIIDDNGNTIVPEYLFDTIRTASQIVNREEKEKIDKKYNLLLGIFRIYGLISDKELLTLLMCVYPDDSFDILKSIVKNLYVHMSIGFKVYDGVTYFYHIDNEKYTDTIYYNMNKDIYINPWFKEYFESAYKSIWNENVIEYYKLIKKYIDEYHLDKSILNLMIEYLYTNKNKYEFIRKAYKYFKSLPSDDFARAMYGIEQMLNTTPSPLLRGNTYYTIKNAKKRKLTKEMIKTYNKFKINKLVEYRTTKFNKHMEILDRFLDECIKNNDIRLTIMDNIVKDNYIFSYDEKSLVNKFIFYFDLFHSIDKEKSIYSEYLSEKKDIPNEEYKILKEFESSYYESIFIIKKIDINKEKITLKDIYTDKSYNVYFYDMLHLPKQYIGKHVFTILIKLDEIQYIFSYPLFIDNFNELELKNTMEMLEGVPNESAKLFLATYILYRFDILTEAYYDFVDDNN